MTKSQDKKRLFVWVEAKIKDALKAKAALLGYSQESYVEKLIREDLKKDNS